jgi:hypothetical protein
VNGAVGVAFTWGLSRIISVVFQWTRDRAVAQQLLPTANHTKPEATHPSGKCRSRAVSDMSVSDRDQVIGDHQSPVSRFRAGVRQTSGRGVIRQAQPTLEGRS